MKEFNYFNFASFTELKIFIASILFCSKLKLVLIHLKNL